MTAVASPSPSNQPTNQQTTGHCDTSMTRRGDKRKFEGDKDTRSIRKVVVSGGKVLRYREQWERHGKEWRDVIEKEIKTLSSEPPSEKQKERLAELILESSQLPDDEAITMMPSKEKLRDEIHGMVRRTTEFMAIFSRVLIFHVFRWVSR